MSHADPDNFAEPSIGLLTATASEMAPLARALGLAGATQTVLLSRRGTPEVFACVTGVGAERALEGLRYLASATRLVCVINAGFAGALDPALGPGAAIEFERVIEPGGRAFSLSASAAPAPIGGADRAANDGALLTADRLVDRVALKAELRARHGAAAVDLESFHLAAACARLGVPLIVIRAISDPADMALPTFVSEWLHPWGGVATLRAARDFLLRPPRRAVMRQLARHTRAAAPALAARVCQAVEAIRARR